MKSKTPKKHTKDDCIRIFSRESQIELFGGKFVSMHKVHRDKSKYDRNSQKREMRSIMRY